MNKKNTLNIRKFDKLNGRKKGGFTLIEVIAVIAIIGVIAAVLLPKFTNYINEAKKLKVVEQSRKVVMAVECYNMTADTKISDTETVSAVIGKDGVKKYFENTTTDINKLKSDMSVGNCYSIVNGDEFTINNDTGVFSNMGNVPKETESKEPEK